MKKLKKRFPTVPVAEVLKKAVEVDGREPVEKLVQKVAGEKTVCNPSLGCRRTVANRRFRVEPRFSRGATL